LLGLIIFVGKSKPKTTQHQLL